MLRRQCLITNAKFRKRKGAIKLHCQLDHAGYIPVFVHISTGKVYTFLTNIRHLAASTFAAIYKQRWQIEIFFKRIKQNLKIKTFLGTSKNAVMSQIWVALTYYLLLSYIRFLSKTRFNLIETARRMKDALMLQMDIMELLGLSTTPRPHPPDHHPPIQLTLSL